MKLLASAATEPTRNPVWGPAASPAIIMTAAMGLKCGTQMNAARAATASAVSTATTGNFARRGTSPFEGNEEGHDSVQHDERTGEVVAVAGHSHTHDCGQRREHQRRKNRQDRLDSGATARERELGRAPSSISFGTAPPPLPP